MILFVSLVLDLLSFTLVLPLFPHLLTFYKSQPSSTLLTTIFTHLNTFKSRFSRPISPHFDTILLGGLLGSLFSLLQALASPLIGHLSDRHGRRTALLFSLVGNIVSCLLWVCASTFPIFLASRVVGGLTEGNVQLALAIAADISDAQERGGSMALVGVAFSVAFTMGPMIGAMLSGWVKRKENPFMVAAGGALGLVMVEMVFVWLFLPETRPKTQPAKKEDTGVKKEETKEEVKDGYLTLLSLTHFLFLLTFSGLEFSLTFMTYDLFSYTSAHNGRLLGFIGLLASLLQGGFVRRANPGMVTKLGLLSCAASFAVLSRTETELGLYLGASGLAVTSACVVTGLTTLASLRIGERERGRVMGGFRSAGQIGRALGPVLFCTLYWWAGRTTAYTIGGAAMVGVCVVAWRGLVVPRGVGETEKKRV
ncbi:MFS general substrate transporter [Ascodesmis nigricans]|uniref:MFS general substrate transporter n=1 Tax=Ascodesmis nigricans TaxID=341454 RepID=A0A4S2N3G7_9PEZI|nr:MFS general substrate transporter [Ascodesmis nigricans]